MNIDFVIELLNNDKVVAIRTDTVYGLICNANSIKAVKKIYQIKNRDANKPLGIFVKNKNEIYNYILDKELPDKVKDMVDNYWPGALTIIFKKKKGIFDYLTSGKDTIGIRIPKDDIILDLLNKIQFPLAQTSCNISGEASYANASEIKEKIGDKVDYILDGGEILNNIASTIVSVSDGKYSIIRTGDIKINE